MYNKKYRRLLKQQEKILFDINSGKSLTSIGELICLAIEDLLEDNSVKCSILLLSGKQLFVFAAPSLDHKYYEIINGLEIGPDVGSSGTAAYSKSRVILENIKDSHVGPDLKEVANKFGFNSCWSTPILSKGDKVIGTLCIYNDISKAPSEEYLDLIDLFTHLSSLLLERSPDFYNSSQILDDVKINNDKFKALTKVIPDVALVLSEKGDYIDIHGCPSNLLYLEMIKFKGLNIYDVLPDFDARNIMNIIKMTLKNNVNNIIEYKLNVDSYDKVFEGRIVPMDKYESGDVNSRHVLWLARDITEKKLADIKIEKLAFYDQLTELPNRISFKKNLGITIEKINRGSNIGALFFLDIDKFKRINDTLGHSAGDDILVQVARRLEGLVTSKDTLARLGGDEFVIILDDIGRSKEDIYLQSSVFAKLVHNAFEELFLVDSVMFKISCSIGIYLLEGSDITIKEVMKFSDMAMYFSKSKGGNEHTFYTPEMKSLADRSIYFESEILNSIKNEDFCAYFQPQVDNNGDIVGAEALIRWIHPTKGIVPPCDFIPLAEDLGFIQSLQNIVLIDSCKMLNKLTPDLISDDFKVSINISQSQFKSSKLKSELVKIINEFNVAPSRIKLEITESMLSYDVEHSKKQMLDLSEQGFSFSIDDFGTGYSCLSSLHSYPVSELKIDKSFIDRINDKKSGLCIVKSIISLARNLNMNVVAEGVETKEQLDILNDLESELDSVQGYFYSKPMPMLEYLKLHK